MISASFYVVGMACIVFGASFVFRRKARTFYGTTVEGRSAVISGLVLIVLGILVILYGFFVFPNLAGWFELRDLVPELR